MTQVQVQAETHYEHDRRCGGHRSLGINLDSVGVQAAWCDAVGESDSWLGDLPPAGLIARHGDEPHRADIDQPPHTRGSGQVWPPQAVVDTNHGVGRFPLAYAWLMLGQGSAQWPWHLAKSETPPAEALAAVTGATVRRTASKAGSSPNSHHGETTLVVPNDLPEHRQQAILDAVRPIGLRLRLLWRPIAAALPWCDMYAAELLEQHKQRLSKRRDDLTLGRLLVVHGGLESLEATVLSLVARWEDGRWRLLPGRHRPDPRHSLTGYFLPHIEHLLAGNDTDQASRWHRQWASPDLPELLTQLCNANAPLAKQWEQIYRIAPEKLSTSDFSRRYLPSNNTGETFKDWISAVRHTLSQSNEPLLGAVATGPLAAVRSSGESFARTCLRAMVDVPEQLSRLMVENDSQAPATAPTGILARGANTFAERLNNHEPTYLDTLPRIELFTMKRGEPAWLPLLQDEHRWVKGGETWHREPNIGGLQFASGDQTLRLILNHEEYETVRKASAELEEPLSEAVPISLAVQIEPAQGGATVQVIPDEAEALGSRSVWVNWRGMSDTEEKPDQYLKNADRILPPLHPRLAHQERWRAVARSIEKAAKSCAQGRKLDEDQLKSIGDQLVDKVQNFHDTETGSHDATAIDCNGHPPGEIGSPHLRELVNGLLKHLPDPSEHQLSGREKQILRVLTYTSTEAPDFLSYLDHAIRQQGEQMPKEVVAACGWCLRDPQTISRFARVALHRYKQEGDLNNNWIKALSEMLRYRENATQAIDSALAYELCQALFELFEAEYEARNPHMRFRNSCLTIVYLLRRRVTENNFLEPNSPLAKRIKRSFQSAAHEIRAEELKAVGGSINLSDALECLIAYIDRRGKGPIDIGA